MGNAFVKQCRTMHEYMFLRRINNHEHFARLCFSHAGAAHHSTIGQPANFQLAHSGTAEMANITATHTHLAKCLATGANTMING